MATALRAMVGCLLLQAKEFGVLMSFFDHRMLDHGESAVIWMALGCSRG
jgi:hypothetical protein